MKKKIIYAILLIAFLSVFNFSCQKETRQLPVQEEIASAPNNNGAEKGHLKQTKTFSSDLVVRWINVQLDMLRLPLPAGTGTAGTDRAQAYSGIALYEAVVNGMPA